ncbi:efflux RND transporter permease subunit [Reinekea blandensis]|uniref:AcrB/AcrD/AcrF family protein n=1 Tax=Reinekea blandensis MED297 TaxID=314283 RepID=A4BH26_9GAMM|nr:efflux RND transporter permease subunit [Reinekea blandensis]EAR08525.1 AcrB/AcrD/AcrF family protein [Reinekea sp. MED297] [Reinekea blandensis MED297]
MFLTRISIKQPVFATMIMVAILVIGLYSYQRLPIESIPNVDLPVVAVVVSYPGASPEAVENGVIEPIENSVNTISGIDSIQSIAQANQAMVILLFDMDVQSDVAVQDVRDRISTLSGALPDGANDPMILRFDPNQFPVLSLAVSSDELSTRELTQLTEDVIVKRLSIIQGVGSATAVGGIPRQYNLNVVPERLIAYNVSMGQVINALSQVNQNLPAGALTDSYSKQTLQINGEFAHPEEFLDVIVAYQGGQPVFVRDVATLADGEAEPASAALLNGQSALAVDIIKVQGANTVGVVDDIQAEIDKLMAQELPDHVQIDVVRNMAREVQHSFDSVINMLIEGAMLTVLIVFLFLNSWRSTVITGLTLPISIIGTMIALYALGFTLNMMSLMALSLAVGLLIDDAIVVRENIMRHLQMGKGHIQAAFDGTNEIGLAVLATTLSIVAVFLPVAFMEGIIGRFFLQFGVTVSVAVLISLFVAFTLDPMLSSVWYDPSAAENAKRGFLGRQVERFDRFFVWLSGVYQNLLKWCLRHRKTTLMIALLSLVGCLALVPRIGAEFVPAVDNSEFQISLETPEGSALDYTLTKARQVDALMREYPEVVSTYSTVGGGQGVNSGAQNTATMVVSLVSPQNRPLSTQEFVSEIRDDLQRIPGIEYNIGQADGVGQISKPVQLNLYGEDFRTLNRLAQVLMSEMSDIDGLTDIESSYEAATPVIGIEVNSDAANELGVSMMQIAAAVRPMVSGENVAEWTSADGETFNVNVRLDADSRATVEQLRQLPISQSGVTGSAATVRLDQVADIVESFGPSQIDRVDLDRQVSVSANLDGVGLRPVMSQLQTVIDQLDLPVGYRVQMGADSEQLAETAAAAGNALLLAVIFIYLVLASQFGSFLQPLAIMVALPMAVIGVMLGLLVGGSTLNMYSMIGFIMLMGLVVKNAILLVDNANQQQRERGMHLFDALVVAGQTRFRPIIMTTLAMIFGMLPMALNLHGGSGENAPMAHAVIGGLISSTLLTLIVVPVVLTYVDSFGKRVGRLFASQSAKAHQPDHEAI